MVSKNAPPPPRELSKGTMDVVSEKLASLKQILPECFSEGELDIDKLRLVIGQAPNSEDERYAFSWSGRSETFRNIQSSGKGTLIPDKKESVNFENTENIFIEGENLEVLKLLQKSYFGKIKMIYIDPPYNTGKDFIYKDNFHINSKFYMEQTGQSKDGIKLTSNMETSGRFHSDWMSFLYSRLYLARNLLTSDGIIFISLDDNEVHNMRLIMDEIFGEENYIASLVWEGGRKNDAKFISVSHDYILCYAVDYGLLRENNVTWRLRKDGLDEIYNKVDSLKNNHKNDYKKITEKLRKWYSNLDKKDPAWQHRHYKYVDKHGVFFGGDISWPGGGGPCYEILHPTTKKPVKIPSHGWRYPNKRKMLDEIKKGNILFGDDENSVPCIKRYLHNVEDQVLGSVIYKDRRNARRQLTKIMGADIFDNPKDPDILQNLIRACTASDDIVMDFFAGSGSTAQAVLNQNLEDGQNRKFLCVQIDEITPKGSIARRQGYETISKIAKERLRRVVHGLADKSGVNSNLDLGFKIFKLRKSHYRIWNDYEGSNLKKLQKQMNLFKTPLITGYQEINVIYECIIKEGLSLNSIVKKAFSNPNTVYQIVDKRNFYICLDKNIKMSSIEKLSLSNDDIFICLEAALNDAQKKNISMICKLRTV